MASRVSKSHRGTSKVKDKNPVAPKKQTPHTVPVRKANEVQVGGNHYKTNGEEHWDRVDRLQLDYFQGQITKYVERWRKKNGIQDLEKAQHFLQKYIELERAKLPNADATRTGRFSSRDRDNSPLKEDSNG